ncbi:MAG: YceI family protein [Chryseolinea sp.]
MSIINKIVIAGLVLSASMCFAQKIDVDIKESSIVWTGKKLTGEHTGLLSLSKGQLEFNKKMLVGGEFEIDMNSISSTDISDKKSNVRLVDHLKSDDFFAVRSNPVSRMKITKVQGGKNNEYMITGDLTIKGITEAVTFPATIIVKDELVTATARITFNRSKYNVKFGSNSFFENLGDEMIYDDIDLVVHLTAHL